MVSDMRGRYYIQHNVPTGGGLPTSQIKRYRPMTGAERMRELRARNPGYDRIYKAKRRAEVNVLMAALQAETIVERVPVRQKTILMLPAPAPRLMLPAPVVDPTMVALNEMVMKRNRQRVAA
jgi:hypothetical protein